MPSGDNDSTLFVFQDKRMGMQSSTVGLICSISTFKQLFHCHTSGVKLHMFELPGLEKCVASVAT